jgi:translation initiation factor 2 beta subunit (eIF-2beta)/eIF-5
LKNIHLKKSDKQTNLLLSPLGLKLLKFDSLLNSNIYFATTTPKIYITNSNKIEAGDWVLPPSLIPFRYDINIKNDEQLRDCKKIIHTIEATYQNIYITSSEEIKEGDYVFNLTSKEVYPIFELLEVVSYEKKIILTTNQDLIKDGVQPINDDFYEWFVKNPTCEEIETKFVEFEVDMELGESCIEYGQYYKTILPREQPYQELFDYLSNELNVIALLTQMQEIEAIVMAKQKHINNAKETDEEAAKKHSGIAYNRQDYEEQYYNPIGCIKYDSFIEGVKWDSKNRYSKEDVLKLLKKAHFVDENIDDWFEKNNKQ